MPQNNDLPSCLYCTARHRSPCGGIRDLGSLARLSDARSSPRRVAAGDDLFCPGKMPANVYTLLSGWIAITDTLTDGRAMILRFALPGDVLPIELQGAESSIGAIAVGDATVCAFTQAQHQRLLADDALYSARYSAAITSHLHFAYDHSNDIALSGAFERVAKLFWELAVRSLRREPTPDDHIYAPLSQIQVGLATGLTPVHVSRTMRKLRQSGLMTFERQTITIQDAAALERIVRVSNKTMSMWK